MGIVDSIIDSVGGTLQDQWKDIVTAADFDEHTLVAPGIRKADQNGRGNNFGSQDILSNGSMILVPENTAAFIFSQSGIEQVIDEPGGYEYRNGQASVFDARNREETGIAKTLLGQAANRIGFSGVSADVKRVAFVNLREMRGVKFGTRGPLVYNDLFYGTDLEIFAYGSISIQVSDPATLVRSFVPPNTYHYSLDNPNARKQLTSEFLHSFIVAVNELSSECRISQLPGRADRIVERIASQSQNAGSWPERFGLRLVSAAVENIEFSDESRELVRRYAETKMDVAAYENVSEHAANIAAQQKVAQGVRDNGFGDAGGMLFGMNLASSMNPMNVAPTIRSVGAAEQVGRQSATDAVSGKVSLDGQLESLKKLKELLDAGILSQEEFDAKKKQILGL